MASLAKVIFLVGLMIRLKSTGQGRSNNGVLIHPIISSGIFFEKSAI
jgi:hypothetical protein